MLLIFTEQPEGSLFCKTQASSSANSQLEDVSNKTSCLRFDLEKMPLQQTIFQVNVTCVVKQITIAFSDVDCGPGISYGPYIDNIHLVELFANEKQHCHLPFISRTTVNGKCQVTLDYHNDRSKVLLL